MFLERDTAGGREQLILDWGYNAWGGKYPPFELDDVVPTRIARELGIPVVSPGIVLEGGSIDVNGAGLLLTTEQCLLNPNRNPTLSRTEIEGYLRDFLGVGKILWLGDGIEGDDTDGHIDDLTRFTDPGTVVTVVEEDPRDSNYGPLRDNLERLRGMTDEAGRPFRIVELPMPPALYQDGQRLPASYANFYIANGLVLVPVFGCDRDAEALAIIAGCFPGRRVVGIDCRDVVVGLGTLHCLSQQVPAA
jgi:agmatine deiminase